MYSWQVLLVTGGSDSNYNRLDSTELLVSGSGFWRLATGLLPTPMTLMTAMSVATVDNILYLTGRFVIIM